MTSAPAAARDPAQTPLAARISGRTGRTALLAGIVVAACALAYHNSLQGPFIFDDKQSIERNPNVRRLWPLTDAMSAPPGYGVAGRPVVALSLAINYAVGGLNVTGYHVANALMHMCSALLMLGICRRTLRLPALAEHFPRDADRVALAIAVLWVVHPLLTESVTYVVQRTELLMGLFFLATLYCFVRGATSPSPRGRVAWCVLAVLACAAGMGSKEVMFVAPIVVLIYDRLFLAGSFAAALRRRWPVYAGLALTMMIIPVLLVTTVALRSKTGAGFETLGVWENLKTQAGVIVHYLRLAVWPDALCIDYDDWPIARSLGEVLPQALLMVALLALTAWGLWRGHPLSFLGAWFFVILAPTSSFLPLGTEIAGERRMYLPTAAVVAVAVLGGRAALLWVGRRLAWRASSVRLAGTLSVIAVACAMMWRTVARNDDYRSAVSIYADAVAKRPSNARARMNLGVALIDRGEIEAARRALEQALGIKPAYADAHYNLGVLTLGDANPDPAAAHFAAATKDRPTWPLPYVRLGEMLAAKGHAMEARQMFESARRLAAGAGQQHLVEEIDAKIAALGTGSPP